MLCPNCGSQKIVQRPCGRCGYVVSRGGLTVFAADIPALYGEIAAREFLELLDEDGIPNQMQGERITVN